MYLVKYIIEILVYLKASMPLFLILSKSSVTANHELVTGITVTAGEFPFAVAILCHSMTCVQCTGALLSTRNIITNINCIHTEDKSEVFYAMAGDVYRIEDKMHVNSSRQLREIVKSVRHPEYQEKLYKGAPYDISILTIKEPYILGDHIKTIPLAQRSLPDKTLCTFVAFGSDSHQHPRGECLHYSIFIVDQNRCSSLFEDKNYTERVYCVQTPPKPDNRVSNELGGFLTSRNKPFHLYGVVTTLFATCENCLIFSNAVANQNWIHKQLILEIDWSGDDISNQHNDEESENEKHSQGGAKHT